jgi:hypothetical protein
MKNLFKNPLFYLAVLALAGGVYYYFSQKAKSKDADKSNTTKAQESTTVIGAVVDPVKEKQESVAPAPQNVGVAMQSIPRMQSAGLKLNNQLA